MGKSWKKMRGDQRMERRQQHLWEADYNGHDCSGRSTKPKKKHPSAGLSRRGKKKRQRRDHRHINSSGPWKGALDRDRWQCWDGVAGTDPQDEGERTAASQPVLTCGEPAHALQLDGSKWCTCQGQVYITKRKTSRMGSKAPSAFTMQLRSKEVEYVNNELS